ncbi:hypothetical protein L0Y65_04730 [Candidatus Micrarchaeota archaeon]|nr:hypothetical protein [Candidatus Micrarchaeota archaeon]
MAGGLSRLERAEAHHGSQAAAPVQETRIAKYMRPIKRAARAALYILLAPVALLSGCGGEEFPRAAQPDSGPRRPSPDARIAPQADVMPPKGQQLYWWPGYVIRDGKAVDVSLGFYEVYFLQKSYASAADIPQSARDAGRAGLQNAVDFASFFLKDGCGNAIIGNNVFLYSREGWEAGGGYNAGLMGFRVVDAGGEEVAACFQKCPTHDEVVMRPGNEKVLFHELLHDAWDSHLTEDQRQDFGAMARTFFNAAGSTQQADERIGAIWNGFYHGGPIGSPQTVPLGFQPFLTGGELDAWANEVLAPSGLSADEINKIKLALRAYFEIHSGVTFGRTRGYSDAERDTFIVQEGFAFLGAHYPVLDELYGLGATGAVRRIPYFMQRSYSPLIRDERLAHMMYRGYGHFVSEGSLRAFAPHVASFVQWMAEHYPALENAGK